MCQFLINMNTGSGTSFKRFLFMMDFEASDLSLIRIGYECSKDACVFLKDGDQVFGGGVSDP